MEGDNHWIWWLIWSTQSKVASTGSPVLYQLQSYRNKPEMKKSSILRSSWYFWQNTIITNPLSLQVPSHQQAQAQTSKNIMTHLSLTTQNQQQQHQHTNNLKKNHHHLSLSEQRSTILTGRATKQWPLFAPSTTTTTTTPTTSSSVSSSSSSSSSPFPSPQPQRLNPSSSSNNPSPTPTSP